MNRILGIALLFALGMYSSHAQKMNSIAFIPEGYVLSETYYGDLNKDGQEDCMLIIKGTNTANVVINRFDQEVDRNRRGIIVLFKNENTYELADKNYDCFYSENEDGGVYYAPELDITTERSNLIIHFAHGRYGYWRYIFRFQESAFKLIGYDASSNHGPRIDRETSINFLTRKKLTRINTNHDAEGGDEVFEETWETIEQKQLFNLSEIEKFEDFDMGITY
ncbi:hypothetical protein [Cellulophaga sp. Z1A5H]|uniref:hypothetical protein n=1 Tax=Cellulophaga sp. Z1A5H TaxID=2687291 RepID=UPI0013FDCC79|nr:hypothetical protein [Cellulophaga sp. Z1A5H]